MSEQATGHPVTVDIRTPAPVPVTDLAALTDLVQGIADRIGAGTLVVGKHFRQEGDSFVFSFAGYAPAPCDEDDFDGEFVHTAARKEPFRIR
ncbi:hypothetical protein SEA_GILGAMESH_17 [Streptomyces phage Gilgamesh]|uniref:Uncharacterized protein n=1 Tax=Streptomyces phage Gilgamesh TaxID=2599890 RepID=A0A5J6TTL3_9CAUD|nr:hypothetical protein QEH35_gp017 [Streptomyces phage Gilgamesh]QFG13209.1 hypothetical protein SEA_GILGAMESH_17 [Streptomyces phage Gilgamesh]